MLVDEGEVSTDSDILITDDEEETEDDVTYLKDDQTNELELLANNALHYDE